MNGEIVHEVRRILAQQAALLQRLHHQRDVALLQIAHAAVDQLGGAAGGRFAEVFALEQQHVIAARGRVDCDADTGSAAADDHDVPRRSPRFDARQHLFALHAEPALPGAFSG